MVNRSTMGIDGDTEDAGQRTVVTIPIDHIVPSMGQYLVMLYQIFIIPIYNYISVFHILFHPIVGKSGQTGAMPGVALPGGAVPAFYPWTLCSRSQVFADVPGV